MTKKDKIYIIKFIVCHPIAILFGLIGCRSSFDKMIKWLDNKTIKQLKWNYLQKLNLVALNLEK